MTAQNSPEAIQYDRIIKPRDGLIGIDFRELWQFRELFFFLAWRDVLLRYKQTYLGVLWAILQPLLTMVIITVIFGMLAKFPSGDKPYAVFTLAAILPWYFFANAMTESSNSLVASSRMISKIYFPRIVIPATAVVSGAMDFLIGFVMLLLIMFWYHVPMSPYMFLLPLFLFMAVLAAFSVGLWFSALNVRYRDVKYIVPFIARMGFYVSSIMFSTKWVADKIADHHLSDAWLFVYCLNPMVGVIDGFRWCILGPEFEPYWPGFFASVGVVLVLLVTGALYFRNTEKTFADVV